MSYTLAWPFPFRYAAALALLFPLRQYVDWNGLIWDQCCSSVYLADWQVKTSFDVSLGKLLIGPDIKQYSVVFLTVLHNTFIDVFA